MADEEEEAPRGKKLIKISSIILIFDKFLGNFWLSFRFFIAILLCFAMTSSQIMRGNLSMAIVCMTNQTNLNHGNQFATEMGLIGPLLKPNSLTVFDFMTNQTNFNHGNQFSSEIGIIGPILKPNENLIHLSFSSEEKCDWDRWEIAHLFAALYFGLIAAVIPLGYVADR